MKQLITLLLTLSLWLPVNGQNDFYMKFDDSGVAGAAFFTCTPALSGFIFAGSATNLLFESNFLIARVSSTGSVQQIRTFPASGYNRISNVINTIDGNFAFFGEELDNSFVGKVTLFKTDVVGNISFIKSFASGLHSLSSRSIVQDAAGNYYLVGSASNSSTFISDVCIIKTDANGNLLDQKLLSLGTGFNAIDLIATGSSGILISGYADNGNSIETIGMVRLDASLNIVSTKWFSDPSTDYFVYDLKEKPNGNIVFCGRYSDGVNPYAALVAEMDATGSILWSKQYSGDLGLSLNGYSLLLMPDGSILVGGEASLAIMGGENHIFAMNLDGTTGNLNWAKRVVSATTSENLYEMKLTNGGDVVAAGIHSGYGGMIRTNANFDLCADIPYQITTTNVTLSVDPSTATSSAVTLSVTTPTISVASFTSINDACLGVGIADDMEALNISVFPSPASDVVTISHDKNSELKVTAIYDITGRSIQPEILENNSGSVSLSVSKLNDGIYFAEINTIDTLKRIEFVVTH